MKTVRYEEYRALARARFGRLRASIENRFSGRAPRQRPRDPAKEALLLAMDKRRWEEAIRQGRIKILKPRSVRIILSVRN